MPIVKRTLKDLERTKVDWRRVDRTTDADIRRQIASDPDTAAEITEFSGFRRCARRRASMSRRSAGGSARRRPRSPAGSGSTLASVRN